MSKINVPKFGAVHPAGGLKCVAIEAKCRRWWQFWLWFGPKRLVQVHYKFETTIPDEEKPHA